MIPHAIPDSQAAFPNNCVVLLKSAGFEARIGYLKDQLGLKEHYNEAFKSLQSSEILSSQSDRRILHGIVLTSCSKILILANNGKLTKFNQSNK